MASVTLSFGGKDIKSYDLSKPATVVGRDPAADIVIDNLGVSRSHCQFLRRDASFILQDMNSSNGTYVNGQKIGEHNLNHGDQIVVGKYTLTFKNERQQAVASAAAHEKIVPDSLNTYMMDGNKIREKMEEMRRAEQSKSDGPAGTAVAPAAEAPAATAPSSPAQAASVAAAAAAPAAAASPAPGSHSGSHGERHGKVVMGGISRSGPSSSTLKRYLYCSLAMNVILAVALCWLLFQYFQQTG